MDALCGAPHAGRAACGGGQNHLKTIYPSPLTCSKSILLSSQASQDPEALGHAPQLDGEGGGVVGLLSLKPGQALWAPATDLGAWDPLSLG